jgi:hypothetical protein
MPYLASSPSRYISATYLNDFFDLLPSTFSGTHALVGFIPFSSVSFASTYKLQELWAAASGSK